MAITITATSSDREIIHGIPQYVTLTTNVPSVMFYTLDGTEPTISSSVYISAINLPTNLINSVRLRVLATNGSDTGTLDNTYSQTILQNTRLPQSQVSSVDISNPMCAAGGSGSPVLVTYKQPHMGTVDAAGVTAEYFDGYGPNGEFPMRQADFEITMDQTMYSETDSIGQTGRGIGTLPSNPEFVHLPPASEETTFGSKTFDPRAMVMFIDSRDESDLVNIIKPHYYDVNVETNRIGALYEEYKSDGNRLISGNFVNRYFNPKTNTYHYYYRDSLTNRWIISTEPAPTMDRDSEYLFKSWASRGAGSNFVFRWVLFKGNHSL